MGWAITLYVGDVCNVTICYVFCGYALTVDSVLLSSSLVQVVLIRNVITRITDNLAPLPEPQVFKERIAVRVPT
jgi:hypothetical protein